MTGLGRCVVTLLNIFFLIISLLLITAGVIAFYASKISAIKDVEDQIKEILESMSSTAGSTNNGFENFSITELFDGIGLGLIISGCVLLILSFFGCCGACCKFKTLIFIYALIITVMLVAEIIVVILLYAAPSTIEDHIKDGLLESLKNYKGFKSSEVATLGWMFVMKEMECCGVNGYKDFSLTHTTDWKSPGTVVTSSIDAPLVCCKTEPSGTDNTAFNCARESTLDIHTDGCFDKVWGMVLGNPTYAAIVYSAAFVFQLLLIIFSYMMYVDGRKKNNKVYPRA